MNIAIGRADCRGNKSRTTFILNFLIEFLLPAATSPARASNRHAWERRVGMFSVFR
jgi:hypothetical protein